MRLLNHLTLGLVSLAMAILLAVASDAYADQAGTAVTSGPSAVTALSDQANPPASDSAAAVPTGTQTTPTANDAPAPNNAPVATTGDQTTQNSTSDASGSTTGANATTNAASADPAPISTGATSSEASPSGGGSTATGQAGTSQNLNNQGSQAGSVDQTGAAESNTTAQTIVQVQISGCRAHCQGITQTQAAEQQNTTVQVANSPGTAATSSDQSGSEGNQISSSITQLEIGCLKHCFGTTNTSTALPSQRAVEQLLRSITRSVLPQHGSSSSTDQNIVDQSAVQLQRGDGLAIVQEQSASQANATIQTVSLSSAQTSELQAALGISGQSAGAVSNQTMQGIWQLQIGCLFHCVQTQQLQQAAQSNTTIQVLLPVTGASAQATVAAANAASQLIWQLQIGCLFWCYDATQQQTAASDNTLVVIAIPASTAETVGVPMETTPPDAPASPSGTDNTPVNPEPNQAASTAPSTVIADPSQGPFNSPEQLVAPALVPAGAAKPLASSTPHPTLAAGEVLLVSAHMPAVHPAKAKSQYHVHPRAAVHPAKAKHHHHVAKAKHHHHVRSRAGMHRIQRHHAHVQIHRHHD